MKPEEPREQANPILIIGGTTEGRRAVEVCDQAGSPFFYSTKNGDQEVESHHGHRLVGGMTAEAMRAFCEAHQVALIVDAAHPFAQNLHANVGQSAAELGIPIIRYERDKPEPQGSITWVDSYQHAIQLFKEHGVKRLLALTGVNSILPLKPYWIKHPEAHFRIMYREASLQIADTAQLPRERIIFYDEEGLNDRQLFQELQPDAIILKESGTSGGFREKADLAQELGIPLYVLRRPALPYQPIATVYGPHHLRRQIELHHPPFFPLKTGFTSGSCATAATTAALQLLLTGIPATEVEIELPNGEPYTIPIDSSEMLSELSAIALVRKQSGDDPDVTNGTLFGAKVTLTASTSGVTFLRGEGVGEVTLPGVGLEVGEPAINKRPREMMTHAVHQLLHDFPLPEAWTSEEEPGVEVSIFVPEGAALAQRTFNPKLGIVGGISIIGTSGIIKPFSSEAFVASIRREVEVAWAMEVPRLVINSGAKSERYLKELYPTLPPQAFVQYGNFIGDTIAIAHEVGFQKVTIGVMIGKAVKLAEGILDTHSKKSVMNKAFIQSLAAEAGCGTEELQQIETMTMARQLWEIIPSRTHPFYQKLKAKCLETCATLLPEGELTLFLMENDGTML